MRAWEYGDDGVVGTINMSQSPDLEFQSDTSIKFVINKAGMTEEPTSYAYTITETDEFKNTLPGGQVLTGNPSTDQFIVSGLKAGSYYRVSLNAKINSSSGDSIKFDIRMPKDTNAISGTAQALDPNKATASKSFLRINNNSNNSQSYKVAWKTFSSIDVGTPSTSTIPVNGKNISVPIIPTTDPKYYAFGTTMFFDSMIEKTKQSAGFGFFLNETGTTGYFVQIETTETAASENKREVRILKVVGNDVRNLTDTQKNTVTSLNGVYGGRSYKIDIKVKVRGGTVTINVYINGFKVTAIDSNGTYEVEDKTLVNKIILPKKQIGVIAKQGEAIFDYVYATNLQATQYDNSEYVKDIYNGLLSNDFLEVGFGDIIYNQSLEEDNIASPDALDEFGTTVREIRKANLKFNSAPAFPISFSTGLNKSVKILGEKRSSFGGEVYVLNNSSALTPLNDQESASFYIYGNTLAPSGILEYDTDEIPEYVNQEPVIFQSEWLQNLSDVEALGQWIKSNIINKGKTVSMEIFGNPLISVGDIVTIKYTYQGLAGTEKFIVTSVQNTYEEGLSTNIVCRTL